ncbi:thermonuclease family protein [Mesorhizobium sp. ANAO-SY3R2]|uniref:thermonuclease family protein n=1 Tax=Mesorhizobium sp. ANAO-SY3R2 TaxID=3166644 RepID=UPI003670D252
MLATTPAAAQDPLIGRASVIDGDTVEIAGERIRFNGVDAPESWQVCHDGSSAAYRCGKAAADALDSFLAASRPIRCEYVERDRYRRFVGDCYRADGQSVARWLVRNGHALDWPRYSKGAYGSEQAKAKADRRGMWQGDFLEPRESRRPKGK